MPGMTTVTAAGTTSGDKTSFHRMRPTDTVDYCRAWCRTTAWNECSYALGDFPFIAPRTMRPLKSTLLFGFLLSDSRLTAT